MRCRSSQAQILFSTLDKAMIRELDFGGGIFGLRSARSLALLVSDSFRSRDRASAGLVVVAGSGTRGAGGSIRRLFYWTRRRAT